MTRIKAILKNKSGSGTPLILAVVLICLLLSTAVFEYMRLLVVAQGVRDSVQSAVVDVATENWDEAYAGLREGYAGGYRLSGTRWYRNVTSGNVYARLKQVLGLKYQGSKYVKYAGSAVEYKISGLYVSVSNAPLAPYNPGGVSQLTVTGTITVEVPHSFSFGKLPPMRITMRFKSVYVPKF